MLTEGVTLYFLYVEDYPAEVLGGYEVYLDAGEKQKRDRFVFERDRIRYLLTRALMKEMLGQKLGVGADAVVFEQNGYGRPFVKGGQGFDFNVSHTDGLIVMGVLEGEGQLGVDVERRDVAVDLRVVDSFFAPEEVAGLHGLAPELKPGRFFALWTLKESYIKAVGKGLSVPLDSFYFEFPEGGLRLVDNPEESAEGTFCCELYLLPPSYQLALCLPAGVRAVKACRVGPGWVRAEFPLLPYRVAKG